MTAGSPTTSRAHSTAAPAAEHQAERIARLFAEGHGIDFVCERGLVAGANGWTRARVLEVVSQRGWTLDGSGRVPRQDRPAVTPGKPVPTVPSGKTQVGVVGGGRPTGADPASRPSPGRAQVAALLNRHPETAIGAGVDSPIPQPALPAPAQKEPRKVPAAPPPLPRAEVDQAAADLARQIAPGPTVDEQRIEQLPVRDLIEQAAGHDDQSIRALADRAREVVADIRSALTVDAEKARLRARLAELDAERDVILAKLGETPTAAPQRATSPPAEPAAARGTHGTWGGFLAHRYAGESAAHIETACPPCFAAKATRGRKTAA